MKDKIPHVLIFILGSIALTSSYFGESIFADNPSSCHNRYDAAITSLKITIGGKIIDPMTNQNTNVDAEVGKGYQVIVTLHSADISSSGNSNEGSIWYGTSAYGFSANRCVKDIKPDTDISMTFDNVFMGQAIPGKEQIVQWYSWPLNYPTVEYKLHWY